MANSGNISKSANSPVQSRFQALNLHDITALVSDETPNCWPGEHHKFSHHYARSFNAGDTVNVSRISCSLHLGTHVEAPFHKDESGKKLDAFPLNSFVGKAMVIDLTNVEKCITEGDLKSLELGDCDICLLKTRNSALLEMSNRANELTCLDELAARHLAAQGIKAVGIDALGMDKVDAGTPRIHNIFFEAEILIYEGLNLSTICEGEYFFIGLPLKIQNAESSPVRAVLINKE